MLLWTNLSYKFFRTSHIRQNLVPTTAVRHRVNRAWDARTDLHLQPELHSVTLLPWSEKWSRRNMILKCLQAAIYRERTDYLNKNHPRKWKEQVSKFSIHKKYNNFNSKKNIIWTIEKKTLNFCLSSRFPCSTRETQNLFASMRLAQPNLWHRFQTTPTVSSSGDQYPAARKKKKSRKYIFMFSFAFFGEKSQRKRPEIQINTYTHRNWVDWEEKGIN